MATLQELDTWGNLEALDTYGNLEALDALTLHTADANVSSAVTVTSNAVRILSYSASVSTAASFNAVAAFIARMASAEALNMTATGASTRIRLYDASESVSGAVTGDFIRERAVEGQSDLIITSTSANAVTFVIVGSVNAVFTSQALAEILGDAWTVVEDGNEVWTNTTTGSEGWTVVAEGSDRWATQ